MEEGFAAGEYFERRHDMGIEWSRVPAITIVTPKGNYFPIPETVNLGDRNLA